MNEGSSTQSRVRRWLRIVIIAFLALAVFLAVWLMGSVSRPSGPGAASGDSLGIRLAGVIPAMGADLHDATGERIGTCLGVEGASFMATSITFLRVFVFDVPQDADNLIVAGRVDHRAAGQPSTAWQSTAMSMSRLGQPVNGRYFLNLTLFKEYHTRSAVPWPLSFFHKSKKRTLTDVDIALYYWHGPRGKAAYTFEGPFVDGAELAGGTGEKCSLVVSAYGNGTTIEVDVNGARADTAEVLVYDRAGRRTAPRRQRSRTSPGQLSATMVAEGLSPAGIAYITVAEEPRKRVFHNIAVLRDTWPDFFAEYKAAIDERTGGQAKITYHVANFKSPEAALAAADLLRGEHIVRAFRNYIVWGGPWGPESLDKATREAALKGARLWLTAWDPEIRGAGACLGALISFDEFRDDLFESLESEDRQVRDESAEVLWRLLKSLNGKDVKRIGDLLRAGATHETHDKLMWIVRDSDAPEARDALESFALDLRPELWCRGLAAARAVEALGPFEQWPEERKVRRYIAMGRKARAESPDEALAEAAAEMLPSLLTPHLAAVDREAFREVLRATGDLCGKDAAIAALVEFVRGARDDGRCSHQIIGAIEYMNGLAGVNIAHIGSDFNYEFTVNWAQAAADAIKWYETGKLTADIPEGYRVKKGDLRIICADKETGEALAVGLYIKGDSGERSRQQVMEFDGGPLAFQVSESTWREPSGAKTRYQFEISWHQGMGSMAVNSGDIPCVFGEYRAWDIHIEHADSPQSTFSDEEVFRAWWDKYGPR